MTQSTLGGGALVLLFLGGCYTPPFFFFFFNDTATTEIYTLSLHDALPIFQLGDRRLHLRIVHLHRGGRVPGRHDEDRSEEHTSELQSRSDLVCRLLLEKKKNKIIYCSPYSKFSHYSLPPWTRSISCTTSTL